MATETIRELAREWWEETMLEGNRDYADESWRRLERDILQFVGERHPKKVTAPQWLKLFRRIEGRGTYSVAKKVRSHVDQFIQHGIGQGVMLHNPVRDLGAALKQKKSKPRPAITDLAGIGQLMKDIEYYQAASPTPERVKRRCMLKLIALLFQRPGEICQAEWSEIDPYDAVWHIPGEKMKMKLPHSVPLSKQAMQVLDQLRPITGQGRWLFPSRWDKEHHEKRRVVNSALRRMGYSNDVMTAHGFRAMAATTLREDGWPSEVIERQLAHADKDKVRAAYQRTKLLGERRKLVQSWADTLDLLCAKAILKR